MPPKAILNRCATLNPHGFGFATKDRIYKTLSYDDFYRELKTIDRDETAILHFRYATHGSIKEANCHPFKDYETGVSFAHNGVLSIETTNDMTDSETAFRTRIVPAIRRHGFNSRQFDDENYSVIGSSRFAYVDNEGNYRLFGTFFKHGECWYSNRNFLPYSTSYSLYAR